MPDINLAYQWAIDTCNDPNVGYAGGSAPDAVPFSWRDMSWHNGKRYCDCSSFIYYALKAGGWDVESIVGFWPFTTYTMPTYLPLLGFSLLNPYEETWQAGDILLYGGDISQGTGHTEMSYNGNYLMGAHNSYLPFADQVSISNYQSSAGDPYTTLWRYTDTPPTPGAHPVPLYIIKKRLQRKRGVTYIDIQKGGKLP